MLRDCDKHLVASFVDPVGGIERMWHYSPQELKQELYEYWLEHNISGIRIEGGVMLTRCGTAQRAMRSLGLSYRDIQGIGACKCTYDCRAAQLKPGQK